VLLDNPYVFADFWKFQNGTLPEQTWKASFAAANKAAHVALGRIVVTPIADERALGQPCRSAAPREPRQESCGNTTEPRRIVHWTPTERSTFGEPTRWSQG
jgi:hypothetical protein